MTKIQKSKVYDLENRTLEFARNTRDFTKTLPKTSANFEYIKQLIRASASVGANYIEANEALSRKDFVMRIKICRKEAKESRYWLELLDLQKTIESQQTRKLNLLKEAIELMMIFSSIMRKSE